MDTDSVKKFNSVYAANDCYYGLDLRNEFLRYFQDRNITGLSALDLGCGEGRYALFLARKGCRVTAIDRSRTGIEKLKKLATPEQLMIRAEVMDIENFVFEDNRFDIVIAATILDHLPDKLRRRTINGIKKALKPGGFVYVNVFTVDDPGYIKNHKPSTGMNISNISDTAECMAYYFQHNELQAVFRDFEILYYYEGIEPDLSHGQPHEHGWACLLAQKSTLNV